MSRFALFVAMCLCLFGLVRGETVIVDQFGNSVGLPLTGGNAFGGYTVDDSQVATSPYHLFIFIDDETVLSSCPHGASSCPENESFWVDGSSFGQATLTSTTYTPTNPTGPQCQQPLLTNPCATGTAVTGNYLASASNPNTAVGMYIFTFNIPQGQMLALNLTYNSSVNPTVVDTVVIKMTNPVIQSIVGDPQFVGLRGQSYQVHGIDGSVYNIITEKETQVNARFIFLTEGQCPLIDGVADINCWSHPGSYLGEIGIQQIVDDRVHAALITAGDDKTGFASITLDGKALTVGESKSYGAFKINYETAYRVSVSTSNFDFELSNSDMFINQALRAKSPLSKLSSHGLLGQTHSARVYPTATRYIEGSVDDYVIADNDIFGTEFVYNQFQQ